MISNKYKTDTYMNALTKTARSIYINHKSTLARALKAAITVLTILGAIVQTK